MKRIFITHILSPDLIGRYKLSTAACNFSFNLMSGGGFDHTFSILGTNVGGEMALEAFSDNRFSLFYNTFFRTKGRIGIQIATFIEQWQIFCQIPRKASVWFYNATTLNVILYLLLRLFKRSVQVNVIELDFTPVEKGIGLNNLFLRIINSCHGNILLSNSQLFTNKNSIILPGVVPCDSGNEPLIESPNNKFLLSGVLLEHISLVSTVMEAFSSLPQCELHITGKTDNEHLIRGFAENYPNIIWHGNTSFQEYLDILHSCTFQLSTRDPKFKENQCNFPSKVIEALLHNRIVISTIMYKQLEGVKYFHAGSSLELFRSSIQNIASLSEDTLTAYANQGEKIAEMFSPQVWNDAMTKIENG